MDELIRDLEDAAQCDGAKWEGCSELMLRAAAKLRRVREAQTTWEVHVNDEWMAGSDDFSDAMHYAAMYESEGTVTVYRVTRSLVPERGEVG